MINLKRFTKSLDSLDEKKLFLKLKKINHESEYVEFKEYFQVKGDAWREKTDEIAAYLAGLGNARGGILFLGVPVNSKGNFDIIRWSKDRPIEEINFDRLCQLLQNKIPEQFYNDLTIRVISSDIHEGYCRIIIVVPPQNGLIYLDFNKLELRRSLKGKGIHAEIKNVSPIFIPLKTKISLIRYPLKDYLIRSSPFSDRKSMTRFSDKLQFLKDYINKQIKVDGWISVEDIKIYCLEITKICRSLKDCKNLVENLLIDREYIIQYPVIELYNLSWEEEKDDNKKDFGFDAGVRAQARIELYFERSTKYFVSSSKNSEYKEYVKKFGEDPDLFEIEL